MLWQHDASDPMNPRTLLMAHEESQVRPVASDMDPFLIGSKGMPITEPLPSEQEELQRWTVDRVAEILAEPKAQGWNKRWLDVLRAGDVVARRGIKVPKYGFGDPLTYDIIAKAIRKMHRSGAVRHGAEAFNYTFPQVKRIPHTAMHSHPRNLTLHSDTLHSMTRPDALHTLMLMLKWSVYPCTLVLPNPRLCRHSMTSTWSYGRASTRTAKRHGDISLRGSCDPS